MERARELILNCQASSPNKKTYELKGSHGYSPFSRLEYRKRLYTFVNATFLGINTLAPVRLALNGFSLSTRDGFVECITCAASLSAETIVSITGSIEPYMEYSTLHSQSCQWKVMSCSNAIQFFDCNEDVKGTFVECRESWEKVLTDAKAGLAKRLSMTGWKALTANVGECVYGCGRCVVQDGDDNGGDDAYERQHYYYCPWRWGEPNELNGCSIMKLKIK